MIKITVLTFLKIGDEKYGNECSADDRHKHVQQLHTFLPSAYQLINIRCLHCPR